MKIRNPKSEIRNKFQIPIIQIIIVLILGVLVIGGCAAKNGEKLEIVEVKTGEILSSIPATGTVMPRNRLEVKPPIAGRIDTVLIEEGQSVKQGKILAWMSSTDRAV